MTLRDRAGAFNAAYAKWPASRLHLVSESGKPVIYGRWLIGNDYRNKTRYYGAYPAGYLDRLLALFPDIAPASTLHVFSGSLPPGEYARCDSVQPAEYRCTVEQLPNFGAGFALIVADPPYSAEDAKRYGTPAIHRGRTMQALAKVAARGAFCCWLDTCWPMHRKAEWRTVGRVVITRSTNHRTRDLTIFERQ